MGYQPLRRSTCTNATCRYPESIHRTETLSGTRPTNRPMALNTNLSDPSSHLEHKAGRHPQRNLNGVEMHERPSPPELSDAAATARPVPMPSSVSSTTPSSGLSSNSPAPPSWSDTTNATSTGAESATKPQSEPGSARNPWWCVGLPSAGEFCGGRSCCRCAQHGHARGTCDLQHVLWSGRRWPRFRGRGECRAPRAEGRLDAPAGDGGRPGEEPVLRGPLRASRLRPARYRRCRRPRERGRRRSTTSWQ